MKDDMVMQFETIHKTALAAIVVLAAEGFIVDDFKAAADDGEEVGATVVVADAKIDAEFAGLLHFSSAQ